MVNIFRNKFNNNNTNNYNNRASNANSDRNTKTTNEIEQTSINEDPQVKKKYE